MAESVRQVIGPVSAYALAKAHGYTGTEEQWATEQAQAGENARLAKDAAAQAGSALAAVNAAAQQAQDNMAAEGTAQVAEIARQGQSRLEAIASAGEHYAAQVNQAGGAVLGEVEARRTAALDDIAREGDRQAAVVAGICERVEGSEQAARESAESAAASAESMGPAELARADAEKKRETAEIARAEAEATRQSAEEQRAQTFAGFEGEIGSLKTDLGDLESSKKIGKNLYDSSRIKEGFYINSSGNETASETLFFTTPMPIVKNESYCFSMVTGLGGYFCVSLYDSDRKFIANDNIMPADFSIENKIKYVIRQYDASYIRVSTVIEYYKDNLMIEKASEPTDYEKYYWYWDDDTRNKLMELILNQFIDYSVFDLPYIKNGKVCCNGSGKTAYYAGIDCGSKVNAMWANFIFEKDGENYGNATLIINPNGVDSMANITDLSLHCQIFPNRIKVDVLGDKFTTEESNKYYYQTLIDKTLETPLVCDGETEHTVILSVSEKSNNVYITVDGTQYSGHFSIVDSSEISGIGDVIGQYVTIEHFCSTDRHTTVMPMFTYLQARDINNNYVLRDYFNRQNGILNNAPTGQSYHLLNNGAYKR